jgi:ketosteroid isomerase-like protein
MSDEGQIRALIERWAEAIHRGDISRVLADHADDIVMFDVPPPQNGVRGIDAYREPEELKDHPENRLRLTLGLRKEQDRWIIAHEHHSFPQSPEG